MAFLFSNLPVTTVWGKLLIGTTFTWADFSYYFIGSGLGWLWLYLIVRGTKLK